MKFYPSCISCFKIQMYILLKSDGMNKVLLWSEGYFSLTRELLQVSGKETWSNFYCNPICSIENSCDVFMGTENGGANKQKKNWCFFQQSWDYMFFAVHRSVFNQCTKIQKLICHNLSEHCIACSPFPSFSSDVVHSAVWLVLRGRAAQQEEPLQWPSPRSWQKPDVPWHTEYMSWYVLQLTNHIWYYKVISNLVIQTSFLHSAHN